MSWQIARRASTFIASPASAACSGGREGLLNVHVHLSQAQYREQYNSYMYCTVHVPVYRYTSTVILDAMMLSANHAIRYSTRYNIYIYIYEIIIWYIYLIYIPYISGKRLQLTCQAVALNWTP